MFNPGISEKSCLDRAPVKRFRNFRINNEPCLYFIGFIIFGQEMRAVAISKVGHKMQIFVEGLEHKINTFSWPIKGKQVIRTKDQVED
ncbi:hypothetical protein P8452_41950 [Trifolium repens]|nr:hypothetical protein P8452_41950 [Trifolium repens]